MPIEPGARLGPYTIVELLGRGGMGEVYRARDPRLDRDVAIKVLPGELTSDRDRRSRFEREARAAAALTHTNILAIHDVGVERDTPFVVSELLEGRTLRDTLSDGPLPMSQVLDVAAQIARGLAAAHDHGIVHRDVKPENIFVTGDGTVKILDFGLAKVTAPPDEERATVTGVTAPGAILGTPGYMSPEQMRGEPAGAPADVYAFGAVLHDLLAGRAAPPAVDLVLRRCLDRDPKRRFGSAADLAFALKQAAGEHRPLRTWTWIAASGAAVAIAAAGVFSMPSVWRRGGESAAEAAQLRSIAVLPLANLSGDAAQQYFADGMTEALIGQLARIEGLRVISRTSVMQYKATARSLPRIAQDLGVDAILEGSVVRAGSRVRIDAKLLDARKDEHRWVQTYEREVQDLLALQADIAQAVADGVRMNLAPADRQPPAGRPVNPAALEPYLKGRYALYKHNETDLRAAIDLFNAALKADPNYAPAYSGIADAYIALRSAWVEPALVMPPAKEAAKRAISLDDTLAEAHVSFGSINTFYEYDWATAESELKRGLALNPNLAHGHEQYALLLSALGRFPEAIGEIETAKTLDPLSALIVADAAWVYYSARDYEKALTEGRRAAALDPRFWYGVTMMGLAYEKLGRVEDAIATLERARTLDSNTAVLEMLAGAYATAGRPARARAVLAELERKAQQGYVCPYEIATVYAGLGDRAAALESLKKSHEVRADCTPWMNVDSKMDALRADPAFQNLIRMMGFRR